jgi:hypothetical protein
MSYIRSKSWDAKGDQDHRRIAIEATKVFGGKFKHNKKTLLKILGGFFWKQLDPEITSLAVKLCGNKVTSLDYSIIWNNLEEVKDTLQKAPGILPIWMNLVKKKLFNNTDSKLIDFEEFRLPVRKNLATPNIIKTVKDRLEKKDKEFIYEDRRKSMFGDILDEIEDTKTYFPKESMPISTIAWKYLVKLKPAFSRRILYLTREKESFNYYLDLFAKIGEIPRYTIIKGLIPFVDDLNRNYSPLVVQAILRTIIRHTHKIKGIRLFWSAECHLVADWLRNEEVVFDNNQLKAPWSWLMKQQADWHERVQRQKREKIEQQYWDCILEEFTYKGWTVTPLVNALALFDEGKEMHHCVASYASVCMKGKSRIFSIRKNNMRAATVELSKGLDGWTLSQIRGDFNNEVSPELKDVGKQILKRYVKNENKEISRHALPFSA